MTKFLCRKHNTVHCYSAIGKKNWLFIGDAAAGDRAATFYTLVGNCRAQGADVYAYLKDLFTRLPAMTNRQIKDITPGAWARQQAGSQALLRAAALNLAS